MILDIIIASFVLILTIIGFKRGIAKTFYGIICLAAAGILAYMAGKLIAEYVYNHFILSSITESIETSFKSSVVSPDKLSKGIFDSLPKVLTALLSGIGLTQKGFASSIDSSSAMTEKTALSFVNKLISPVIISFLTVGFIILLFVIFMLILRLVIGRRILKLFKLPFIRWVNAFFGGILGLTEGVIIVFLVITVLRMAAGFSSGTMISKELLDSSYLFSSIYYWDFIVLITNIII